MNRINRFKLKWRKALTVQNKKLLVFSPNQETNTLEFRPSKSLIVNMGSRIIHARYIKNLNNRSCALARERKIALYESNPNKRLTEKLNKIKGRSALANTEMLSGNSSGYDRRIKEKSESRFTTHIQKKQLNRQIRGLNLLFSNQSPLIGSKEVENLSLSTKTYASTWNKVSLIQKENFIIKQVFDLRDKIKTYNSNNFFKKSLEKSSKFVQITPEEIIQEGNQIKGIHNIKSESKLIPKIKSVLTLKLLLEFEEALTFIKSNIKKIKR